jgi:lipopolysaccharide transport system permease protein
MTTQTMLSDETEVRSERPQPAAAVAVTADDLPELVIEPRRGWIGIDWAELSRFRELLYFLVWRDVKVRYRHTVLGAAWAVLQPVLTTGVFTIVFGRLAHLPSDGRSYALFSFAALVPWTYCAASVSAGANSLVGSEHLISKVYFPRLLIPAAATVTPLVDFAITLALLLAIQLVHGGIPLMALVLLPAFTLLALATALAASLWCSALNVAYRDVRYVLPFFIQFWLFATPVAYPASLVPEPWRMWYGVNPMATVVEGFRWAVLQTAPPGWMALVSVLVVIAALASGVVYFRRMEGTFADVL